MSTDTVSPTTDGRTPSEHERTTGGSIGGRRLAAASFLVLVTVPGLAYLAGVRTPPIDNRPVTAPPSAERVLALDTEALQQVQDHLGDTVPGREFAVRADAWTDLHLLGRSPNPDVLLGEDGWLFLRSTLEITCESDAIVEDVRRQMERAATLVEGTGRRWATAVAPDKAVLYGDHLPDDFDHTCFDAYAAAIETELEADPPTGYVPTWDLLRDARDLGSEPVYHVHDTHWTDAGSLPFALAVAGDLDPQITDDVTVTPVLDRERVGDLTLLYGFPEKRPAPAVKVERPGITSAIADGNALARVPDDIHDTYAQVLTATGGRVIPGSTALWHDSFGEIALPHLAPFFEELIGIRRRPIARPWVSGVLADADTIIYESVQRALNWRWTNGNVVAQLAWALRDDLQTRRSVPGDGGWIAVDRATYDVIALPVGSIAPESLGEPLLLELRGAIDADPVPGQNDFDRDTPRLFDLSRVGPVTHVRVVDRDGSPVPVTDVMQIATS